ncbi:two pore channel [Anaeramoeba flamelloides]|uniref:Two pore channel n=1 Tax=Anaeramoeba flamelloides TaxID=1746091 RepID=A0AAV7YY95_9EUKA|nr:two pore channel [Anaeramoeba flamelloides]
MSKNKNKKKKKEKNKLDEYKLIEGLYQDEEEKQKYNIAVSYIRDASQLRDPYSHLTTQTALKYHSLSFNKLYDYITRFVWVGLFLLTLIEHPQTYKVNIRVSLSLELVGLLWLFFVLFVTFKFQGWVNFKKDDWNFLLAILLITNIIEVLVLLIIGYEEDYVHFSRFFRVYYIVYGSFHLRDSIKNILKTFPSAIHVTFLIVFFIILFSSLCMIYFEGSDEGDIWFPNFGTSMWNIMVLFSTANFPDIMMPAYTENRWISLFFVIFLVTQLYLFANLVLGAIYDVYRKAMSESVKHQKIREWKAVLSAFKTIDSENRGCITRGEWRLLVKNINPKLNPMAIDLWFEVLDTDDDGFVDEYEFLHIVETLNSTLIRTKSKVSQKTFFTTGILKKISKKCYSLVEKKFFVLLIDFAIFVNLVVTIIIMEVADGDKPKEISEYIFTLIYFIEMVLKLTAYGWRYFKSKWNIFDFIVVTLSVISALANLSDHEGSLSEMGKFTIMLRTLRLLKTIQVFPGLSQYFSIASECLPAFIVYGLVLFLIFYIFSLFGMEIYGGKIYEANEKLKDTGYLAAGYLPNCFNTFPESLIVLFELMIINNWFVIVEGHVAVTGNASYIFFIVFYFIVIMVILNIVIAFILEVFNWKQEHEGEALTNTSEIEKELNELQERTKIYLEAQGIKENWVVKENKRIFNLFQNIFEPNQSLSLKDITEEVEKKVVPTRMHQSVFTFAKRLAFFMGSDDEPQDDDENKKQNDNLELDNMKKNLINTPSNSETSNSDSDNSSDTSGDELSRDKQSSSTEDSSSD